MSKERNQAAELRVGIRFERPAPAVQAALDRFVFALMQKKARATQGRAAGSAPANGAERRRSPRVELGTAEQLRVTRISDRPRGVLGRLNGADVAEGASYRVCDIATTGCSFLVPESECPAPKSMIRIKLRGMGLDVEVTGKVIHAQRRR
jgi:hypothetical protein